LTLNIIFPFSKGTYTKKKGGRLAGLLRYILSYKMLLSKSVAVSEINYFPSSETVSFFLPRDLRAASTLRPLTVDILSLNPCLFFLFLTDGWKVLFMIGRF